MEASSSTLSLVQSTVQVRVDLASDATSTSSSTAGGACLLVPASAEDVAVDWHSVCLDLEQNLHLNVPQFDAEAAFHSRSVEHLDMSASTPRRQSAAPSRQSSLKCPRHHRSNSVRSTQRSSHYLSPPLPPGRPRGTSLPGTGPDPGGGADGEVEEGYYLLRQFVVSRKNKVVNRGDSFRNRRRIRESSINSSASSISTENVVGSPPAAVGDSWGHVSGCASSASAAAASVPHGPHGADTWTRGTDAPFRVLILGLSGVGKTALTAQFMTSEYLNTYDASLDEDSCARSVSVLLDGEESELVFIDHPHGEISIENCMSTYDPQAYIVVYSVVDAGSFAVAEDLLHFLWRCDVISTHAVILVGNKMDLARSRCISSQDGKSLAVSFDCKFIETSSGIQHNVDELLVGILKQIRLKLQDPEQARSLFRKRSSRRKRRGVGGASAAAPAAVAAAAVATASSSAGSVFSHIDASGPCRRTASLRVRGLLGKVWCADGYKSRSCEDLHVL